MTVIKGDAYILRTCEADMTSHGGFVWPREGAVEAQDWEPTDECGNGLHGFLWGEGAGRLADWSDDAVWIVARVSEWIDLGGKVKFPSAEVVFAGARHEATQEIVRLGARGAVIGGTATAGNRGIATAGFRGIATAGDYGIATAGFRGTATAGYRGTATAGDYGILQIQYFDGNRRRVSTAYVGENGIKSNTPYRLNDQHEFEEVTQ